MASILKFPPTDDDLEIIKAVRKVRKRANMSNYGRIRIYLELDYSQDGNLIGRSDRVEQVWPQEVPR